MTSPATKGKTGTVVKASPYQRLLSQLKLEAETSDSNGGASYAESMAEQIENAETLEAAFAAQDKALPNGKDLIDEELHIKDFTVVESDRSQYTEGLPYYMRIEAARLSDGQPVTFATGATNIVLLLWRAKNAEWLPLDVRITGKDTANGTVLGLKLIPKRAI
jgi:hypothetical protein